MSSEGRTLMLSRFAASPPPGSLSHPSGPSRAAGSCSTTSASYSLLPSIESGSRSATPKTVAPPTSDASNPSGSLGQKRLGKEPANDARPPKRIRLGLDYNEDNIVGCRRLLTWDYVDSVVPLTDLRPFENEPADRVLQSAVYASFRVLAAGVEVRHRLNVQLSELELFRFLKAKLDELQAAREKHNFALAKAENLAVNLDKQVKDQAAAMLKLQWESQEQLAGIVATFKASNEFKSSTTAYTEGSPDAWAASSKKWLDTNAFTAYLANVVAKDYYQGM